MAATATTALLPIKNEKFKKSLSCPISSFSDHPVFWSPKVKELTAAASATPYEPHGYDIEATAAAAAALNDGNVDWSKVDDVTTMNLDVARSSGSDYENGLNGKASPSAPPYDGFYGGSNTTAYPPLLEKLIKAKNGLLDDDELYGKVAPSLFDKLPRSLTEKLSPLIEKLKAKNVLDDDELYGKAAPAYEPHRIPVSPLSLENACYDEFYGGNARYESHGGSYTNSTPATSLLEKLSFVKASTNSMLKVHDDDDDDDVIGSNRFCCFGRRKGRANSGSDQASTSSLGQNVNNPEKMIKKRDNNLDTGVDCVAGLPGLPASFKCKLWLKTSKDKETYA